MFARLAPKLDSSLEFEITNVIFEKTALPDMKKHKGKLPMKEFSLLH